VVVECVAGPSPVSPPNAPALVRRGFVYSVGWTVRLYAWRR